MVYASLPQETAIKSLWKVGTCSSRICGNASWAPQTPCSGISNILNKTSMTNNHSLENVAIGGQPLPCFLGTQQILWHTNSSHRTTQKKPMGKGFRKEVKVLSLDHMVLSNLISSWVGWKENYWNGKDHWPMTVKWPEIHPSLIIPLTFTAHLLSMWGGLGRAHDGGWGGHLS